MSHYFSLTITAWLCIFYHHAGHLYNHPQARTTTRTRYLTTTTTKMSSNSNMEMWFAAGTAAVGSCAAVVPFSNSERWRVWVFLALNVLLLAILYTSTSIDTSSLSSEECKDQNKRKQEQEEEHQRVVLQNENGNECEKLKFSEPSEKVTAEEDGEDEVESLTHQDQVMSKEELNRKAEAFIAMFRQQLVLDAKNRSKVQFADKRRRSCS